MAPQAALYGRNARLIYGLSLQIEADSYSLQVSAPTVDTTNISIYGGQIDWPYDQVRLNPLVPLMAPIPGDKRRFMEFGTPGQVTFGGVRRAKVTLSGICTAESRTPHVGNFVRILLTHDAIYGSNGIVTIPAIITDFTLEQSVRGYMRWNCAGESTGDFDVTQIGG
jgi:hypothetical protein